MQARKLDALLPPGTCVETMPRECTANPVESTSSWNLPLLEPGTRPGDVYTFMLVRCCPRARQEQELTCHFGQKSMVLWKELKVSEAGHVRGQHAGIHVIDRITPRLGSRLSGTICQVALTCIRLILQPCGRLRVQYRTEFRCTRRDLVIQRSCHSADFEQTHAGAKDLWMA
jgi:hypothetical protein